MSSVTFKTTLLQMGNNTGIEVPEKVVEKLGGGKKPLVIVDANGYEFQNAIGKMAGKYLIGFSAAHRKASGLAGGDALTVTVRLDSAPRTVEAPAAFLKMLSKNKSAAAAFDKLAPSRKKAMVDSFAEAKTAETRQRRMEKALASLSE